MLPRDFAILLGLAAIWGASFLFMRIAVLDFHPVVMTQLRILIAALCLLPWLLWRYRGQLHWRDQPALLFVGLSNSALPFCLLGFSTVYLTAGFTAILNSSVPFWSALIAWLWLGDRLSGWQQVGLLLAFSGVAALGLARSGLTLSGPTLAVLSAVGATLSYGISANFSKRYLAHLPAMVVATCSLLWGSLLLLPLSLTLLPEHWPGIEASISLVLLGVLCTALAFTVFYQLIQRIGPTRTVSVTFLIPLFGMFWGWLVLAEPVTPGMLAGCAVILCGTALSLGLWRPGR